MKLLILFLLISTAFAGQEGGNGGDVVVCTKNGKTTYEVLDLYEVQQLNHQEPDFPEGNNFMKIAQELVKRFDQRRAQIYLQQVNTFLSESSFTYGTDLPDIPDSEHLFIPPHCQVKQIAIQTFPPLAGAKRYEIDGDLWDKLDDMNKATLIAHEIIYREALGMGHENSITARAVNARVLTKELNSPTSEESVDQLYMVNLPKFTTEKKMNLVLTTVNRTQRSEYLHQIMKLVKKGTLPYPLDFYEKVLEQLGGGFLTYVPTPPEAHQREMNKAIRKKFADLVSAKDWMGLTDIIWVMVKEWKLGVGFLPEGLEDGYVESLLAFQGANCKGATLFPKLTNKSLKKLAGMFKKLDLTLEHDALFLDCLIESLAQLPHETAYPEEFTQALKAFFANQSIGTLATSEAAFLLLRNKNFTEANIAFIDEVLSMDRNFWNYLPGRPTDVYMHINFEHQLVRSMAKELADHPALKAYVLAKLQPAFIRLLQKDIVSQAALIYGPNLYLGQPVSAAYIDLITSRLDKMPDHARLGDVLNLLQEQADLSIEAIDGLALHARRLWIGGNKLKFFPAEKQLLTIINNQDILPELTQSVAGFLLANNQFRPRTILWLEIILGHKIKEERLLFEVKKLSRNGDSEISERAKQILAEQ